MAAKIKKGDTVIVIAGRDKGRTGEVIEMRREDGRVLVRGVNMVKRHQRQTAAQEGGIVSKEASIHVSNVALADPKDGKPTRVDSNSSARATTARKCASPSVRELRSMADTDEKQAKRPNRRRSSTGARSVRPMAANRSGRTRPSAATSPTKGPKRPRKATRPPSPRSWTRLRRLTKRRRASPSRASRRG